MRVFEPRDPRTAPFELLQRLMPVPRFDTEARDDRKLLHRIDLHERVRG